MIRFEKAFGGSESKCFFDARGGKVSKGRYVFHMLRKKGGQELERGTIGILEKNGG